MKDRISDDEKVFSFDDENCEYVHDVFDELDYRGCEYLLNGDPATASEIYERRVMDPDDCLTFFMLEIGQTMHGNVNSFKVERIA